MLISGLSTIFGQASSPRMTDAKDAAASFDSVFRKYDSLKMKLPIEQQDVEILFGGSIKVDSYNVRNAVRLTKNVDDQINQWRQRIELGIQSNFGKESHGGRAVVESKLMFGSTLFWRTGMTRSYGEFESPVKQSFINPPVELFVNEAWVSLNLDTLFGDMFATTPHSVKAGFFPFLVGRGLSLGDRSAGGVSYMGFGFTRQGVQTYAPKYAPGLLLHGEFPDKNLSYDFYYSPLVSEDVNTYVLQVGKSAHVVDKDDRGAHGRHIVAGSVTYLLEPVKNAKARIEPYFVYYNSQRQTVSAPADAPMYFTTYGMMVDLSVGPVKCNLEVASQYGRQDVLPWEHRYSLDGSTTTTEFNPKYKVKLAGSMLAFDLAYHIKDVPFVPSMSLGYFSGGDYPYNGTIGQFHAGEGGFTTLTQAQQATDSQKDKTYSGFLPLRDWGYRGMWCNPLIMFSAAVIPRPVDVDIAAMQAYNDFDCATNLVFLGIGGTWYPYEDRKKMGVSSGMFFNWEANPPHKWNLAAVQPGSGADDGSVVNVAPAAGVVGWYTKERASSFLGTELNIVVDYKIAQDCMMSVRAGVFCPGQLYADLVGQPNMNSSVTKNRFAYASTGIPTVTSVTTNAGLGTTPAYGLYTRLSYVF